MKKTEESVVGRGRDNLIALGASPERRAFMKNPLGGGNTASLPPLELFKFGCSG